MTPCEQSYESCPIFGTMSPKERTQILQFAEYRSYDIGQTVIREKDLGPNGLWMLRSGHCEVVSSLTTGGEQQMAFLNPGAIFGEVSFFDPSPHSATVRAVEPCEVMFLAHEKFDVLLAADVSAATKLLINMGRMMAGKLRHMDYYKLDLFAVSPEAADHEAVHLRN